MGREQFQIEYVFDKVSRNSLWNHLTTVSGLSSWFAEKVVIEGNLYNFKWKKTVEQAEIIEQKPGVSVRYRWLDDEEEYYFEFLIHGIELTGGTALEIIDFAEPDEKADAINLWDTQIDALKRTLGI
jgi:uncharacterized protein YndB with AHSA1/START domain